LVLDKCEILKQDDCWLRADYSMLVTCVLTLEVEQGGAKAEKVEENDWSWGQGLEALYA